MERKYDRFGREILTKGTWKVCCPAISLFPIKFESFSTVLTFHYSYFVEWAQEMKKVLVRIIFAFEQSQSLPDDHINSRVLLLARQVDGAIAIAWPRLLGIAM
jgi:hypothetical protein